LSLRLPDGFEPHAFIFYIPLLEVFSITEKTMERFKPCFAHLSIPNTEIFSRTNL
jgi:hypothetical protein